MLSSPLRDDVLPPVDVETALLSLPPLVLSSPVFHAVFVRAFPASPLPEVNKQKVVMKLKELKLK